MFGVFVPFSQNRIVFYVLSAFNIVTLIALIFFERRNPEKVIKWAGVLLFLPFIGFILYIIFGKGPILGSRRRLLNKIEKDSEYAGALKYQTNVIDENLLDKNPKVFEMIKFNIDQNKSICTPNNDVKLFFEMHDFYDSLFYDILNAKEYINVCFFIIKPDKYGKKLVDALTDKAKEGVEIRLIYDDIGSILTPSSFFRKLKKAGGKVYKFFPAKLNVITGNVNYRNHRKIVVVDGVCAYTGGCNIGKEYLSEKKHVSPWKDTQMRITGAAVNMLNVRFLQDYNFASGEYVVQDIVLPAEPQGNTTMQIVSCGPDSHEVGIESAYIKAIYSAVKCVYIETPYLILDEPFKMALITAARCGIDVKIIIPGKPDKRFVYYSTLSFAEELVENGVKVFVYNGFIHSKVLVIDDDISSVGTFNIDIRSFKLHFEVTAFLYGKEIAETLIEEFNNNKQNSKEMDETYMKNRSLWQRFMERVAILFSPLF